MLRSLSAFLLASLLIPPAFGSTLRLEYEGQLVGADNKLTEYSPWIKGHIAIDGSAFKESLLYYEGEYSHSSLSSFYLETCYGQYRVEHGAFGYIDSKYSESFRSGVATVRGEAILSVSLWHNMFINIGPSEWDRDWYSKYKLHEPDVYIRDSFDNPLFLVDIMPLAVTESQ